MKIYVTVLICTLSILHNSQLVPKLFFFVITHTMAPITNLILAVTEDTPKNFLMQSTRIFKFRAVGHK